MNIKKIDLIKLYDNTNCYSTAKILREYLKGYYLFTDEHKIPVSQEHVTRFFARASPSDKNYLINLGYTKPESEFFKEKNSDKNQYFYLERHTKEGFVTKCGDFWDTPLFTTFKTEKEAEQFQAYFNLCLKLNYLRRKLNNVKLDWDDKNKDKFGIRICYINKSTNIEIISRPYSGHFLFPVQFSTREKANKALEILKEEIHKYISISLK